MKTMDLQAARQEEKISLDDSIQYKSSQKSLKQFTEIKKVLINVSFVERKKKIISPDII